SDRTAEVLSQFAQRGWDALVAIGGDGTMGIAEGLARAGLCVIGVPKTIDNDLDKTFSTFGFDTAVGFATECIDRLHSTAQSHRRVMVVETMGRYAGWIALHTGLAGGAHAILLPELPFDIDKVAQAILAREAQGHQHSIVVVAEGATPVDGQRELVAAGAPGRAERLGGIGARVAEWLEARTGKEARSLVLGHLLRGGSPSAFDRVCALRFGAAAVRALAAGQSGVMVSLGYPDIVCVPLADVAGHSKRVPADSDTIQTARDLGICLG
ncbi:MAG TPA: ATP-dependent 6-phosphofructokinase, partial [Telluria sp.]|nr:ATP-dependent 6-phosphofructokinase [Telluria sp.]